MNRAPVANAGPDQTVASGAMVQLDGSASTDADNDALTYQWSQTGGISVELTDSMAANPGFDAPAGMSGSELLEFSLIVSDGTESSQPDLITVSVQGTAPLASDGFVSTVAAAVAKGHFSLNNPWTQADLDFENVSATIDYQDIVDAEPPGRVVAYTVLMETYLARRRQCEEDYNQFYSAGSWDLVSGGTTERYNFRDRKCYPTLQLANELDKSVVGRPAAGQVLQRYGYYCGGGFPDGYHPFDIDAPEPLDPVDNCCRLHDAGVWNNRGTRSNECGILMCLRQANMWPAGLDAQLGDVVEARIHWYGDGVDGGAAFACPGNQSNDLPPFQVRP